jgi:hypothetical protein
MPYQTFDLRFADCDHTLKIPLLHNQDDSRCFICHPELRDQPDVGEMSGLR